jgi:thiamine-monophosphate kinase
VRGGAEGVHGNSADANRHALIARFEFPTPRVALGQRLRGLASACIDVSDGVYIDARRMLAASGCGGHIDAAQLPLSAALRALAQQEGRAAGQVMQWVLGGGEDYELCFCAPPGQEAALQGLAARLAVRITRIGTVRELSGLSVTSLNQAIVAGLEATPFDHFGR